MKHETAINPTQNMGETAYIPPSNSYIWTAVPPSCRHLLLSRTRQGFRQAHQGCCQAARATHAIHTHLGCQEEPQKISENHRKMLSQPSCLSCLVDLRVTEFCCLRRLDTRNNDDKLISRLFQVIDDVRNWLTLQVNQMHLLYMSPTNMIKYVRVRWWPRCM